MDFMDPPATRNNPAYRAPARTITPTTQVRRTTDQVDGDLTHHPVTLDVASIVSNYEQPQFGPALTFKPHHHIRRVVLSLTSDARQVDNPVESQHTDVFSISRGQLRAALRVASDAPGVNPGLLVLSTAITNIRQKKMFDPDIDTCTMFVSIKTPATSLFGSRSTGASNELCFEPTIVVCPTNSGSGPSDVFQQIGIPVHVDYGIPFVPRVFRSPRQYWSPLAMSCVDAALTGTQAFMLDVDKVRHARSRGATDLVSLRRRPRTGVGAQEAALPVIRGSEELGSQTPQLKRTADYPHYAVMRYLGESQSMEGAAASNAVAAPSIILTTWTSILNYAMASDGIGDIQSSLIDLRIGGTSGFTHDTVLTILVKRPAVAQIKSSTRAAGWMVPQLSMQVELVGVLFP